MHKNIYLISAELNDYTVYKIGLTKRAVCERIKDFKTGNISDFKALKVYNTDNYAHTIESRLHLHFKAKRIDMDREWFNLTEEDIESFLPLCDKFYNAFKMLEENNTYIQAQNWQLK